LTRSLSRSARVEEVAVPMVWRAAVVATSPSIQTPQPGQWPDGSVRVVGFAHAYRYRFNDSGSCTEPITGSSWVKAPSAGPYERAPFSYSSLVPGSVSSSWPW